LYGYETWSLTLREERRLRVFENRLLRRIFGSKRDEVTGKWRKLHEEELNDLYSKIMNWAKHVIHMGERRVLYRFLVGKPEGRNRLEDPGVDGMIILKWIFRKWDVRAWTGSSWLRIGTGGGHL